MMIKQNPRDQNWLLDKWKAFEKESCDYISSEPYKPIVCNSPFHNFPSHLYIPAGQIGSHQCPACGVTISVISNQPTWLK